MMDVTVNADRFERRINALVKTDIPRIKALTNGVLARDTKDRLNQEIQSIFQNPVRFVATAIGVVSHCPKNVPKIFGVRCARLRGASDRNPIAAIGPKDIFGGKSAAAREAQGDLGGALATILEPHIYGGKRRPSATEVRLRNSGVIRKNEWIIPAKGVKIPRGEWTKMLVHFKTFREGGFTTTRSPNSRRRRRRPSAYDIQWIGNKIKGIFRMNKRGRGKMLWVVVQSEPRYTRSFRYFEIIDDNVRKKKEKIGNWAKRKVLKNA